MNIKRLCGIIALAAVSLSQLPCFASEVTAQAVYDAQNETVIIKGNANGNAVITVIAYDTDPAELSIENMPLFIRQTEFFGNYTYEIPMPDEADSGKYKVYVTTAEGEAEAVFSHMNSEKADAALELINEAASAQEYKSIIREYAADFGIDLQDTDYISNEDKIYDLLFSLKAEYTQAYEVNSDVYKMLAIAQIEDTGEDMLKAVLQKYQTYLKIDYNTDILNDVRLDTEAEAQLYKLLADVDYAKEFKTRKQADFAGILEECKAVAAVKTAISWQNLKEAVEIDFDCLKAFCDSDDYKNVKNRNEIYSKAMTGAENVTNLSDVEKLLKSAAGEQYADENKSNQSGGSGGGSGGSGGGSSVSIPVTVKKPEQIKKMVFDDVPEDFWGYEAIAALSEKKLVSGYEDNTFCPNNNITRAEFVKLILGLDGFLQNTGTQTSEEIVFSDVDNGAWYAEAVYTAAKRGLVSGSDGMFRPNDNITREDAAVIMYRLLSQSRELYGGYIFTDRSEISQYARDAVGALAARGYIQGVSEGVFAPKAELTRAQATQMIYNVLELV